jgi:DNA invertase Pin-like site-specific DNA recombinase
LARRIRDKIAASKRKGIWMGGPVPLGYNVRDRKLVVADRVRLLESIIEEVMLDEEKVVIAVMPMTRS